MKNVLLLLTILLVNPIFSQKKAIQDSTLTSEEVSFDSVEKVPVYPGCDRNMGNQALKECMNERVKNHIKKNFDYTIANKLGLKNGAYKINVFFKIDTLGYVSDLVIKSDSPIASDEARRVVDLFPKFEPGIIDGKPVIVPYFIPIKILVDNKQNASGSFPVYRGCSKSINNEDLKNCTTKKIMNYIKLSINNELVDKIFPLDKTTQFQVSFTINKTGKLENINAKAHKREMAIEAIQVLKRMPKLKKPGYLNGEPIDTEMSFLMTIYF